MCQIIAENFSVAARRASGAANFIRLGQLSVPNGCCAGVRRILELDPALWAALCVPLRR